MIFARRRDSLDEWGDVTEDYEGVEVTRAAKVARPLDDSTPARKARMIKLRAIRVLRDNGFSVAEAAIATGYSISHLKRRSAQLRALAEQCRA